MATVGVKGLKTRPVGQGKPQPCQHWLLLVAQELQAQMTLTMDLCNMISI